MGKFFFVIFSLPKFGPCFCVLFVCLFHKICVHACEYDEGMTFHLVILCITCIVAGVKKGTGREKGNLGSREPCAYALPHCLLYVRIAISLFIYNNILCFFSSSSSVDARLRRDGVELYNALWGRLTPSCVPPQGVSVCFPLCLRIRRQSAKYDHSFNITMITRTNPGFKTISLACFNLFFNPNFKPVLSRHCSGVIRFGLL